MTRATSIRTGILTLLLAATLAASAYSLGIDATDKYAWGENIGWLNWGTAEGAVDVPETDGDLTGYVWGENVGWISLNCSNTSSCGTVDYGVTRTGDDLAGYAWGENVGWISFSCANTATCGTVDYGANINTATNELEGYAWGENVGWIVLNCTTTASCGTVSYRVKTEAPEEEGGPQTGGILVSPGATPSTPPPGVGGIVINDGAPTTGARIVRLTLFQPFDDSGDVTVTLLNEADVTPQDRVIIAGAGPQRAGQFTSAELSGGARRPFSPSVPEWDLCAGKDACPAGSYTVYAQFIKPGSGASAPQAVLAALGDDVSDAYGDSISLTTPAPTPTSSAPAPTPTPAPTPPAATPSTSPPSSAPPSQPPVVTPPTPLQNAINTLTNAIDGAADAIFGPLGPTAQEWCGSSGVQAVACGSTAMGLAAALAGILAGLVQKELVAALFSMLQVIGLKRRARVWGVVYDTATKRPVPAAKVELLSEDGRLLETRFADRDGRYGFLTTPQSVHQEEMRVSVRAQKPGYRFPTTSVAADVDYVVYDRLYKGGVVTIRQDAVINYNIPMDPVSARRPSLSGWGSSLVGTAGDRLLAFGFYVGLVAVPLNYWLQPSGKNLAILIAFFTANLFRLLVVYRPYGMTVDAATGKPLPFALVTLVDTAGGRVGFAVSDEHGRFILSGQRGQAMDVVAYTPANIAPQRTTTMRISSLGSRGWITLRLRI